MEVRSLFGEDGDVRSLFGEDGSAIAFDYKFSGSVANDGKKCYYSYYT